MEIQTILFDFIDLENHGRAIRQRRQAISNQFRQDVGNLWSNTYNSIRDNVVPAIGSTVDRFSQNWDRYKQNINQGFNQMGQTWDRYKQNMNQGWNQFRQDYFQQYPTYNSGYNNNRTYSTSHCSFFSFSNLLFDSLWLLCPTQYVSKL